MAEMGGDRRRRTSTFGNVRRLPSGRYQASYWHRGKRYPGPKTYDTKADADAWLATQRTAILHGDWVDPEAGRERFDSFATAWLDHRPDLRPRSKTAYRSLLKVHLVPAFGNIPIGKITPSQVSAWYADLVARAPGTAPAAYRLLRAIMNSAVSDEKLGRSPCKVAGGSVDRAAERPMLTIEQVQHLTDAMPEASRIAVVLAAWGGLRRGEVLGLRRRHVVPLQSSVRVEEAQVELSDGTVTFGPPKTDAGIRTVHLPPHAMAALTDHLATWVAPGPDALLLTGRDGVPMRPKTLAANFDKARKSSGLPAARFHDLRHFALTMAATTGASTKELMRRAGHRSAAAALRYQHATEDRDRAIATALGELVEQAEVLALGRNPQGASRTNRARKQDCPTRKLA